MISQPFIYTSKPIGSYKLIGFGSGSGSESIYTRSRIRKPNTLLRNTPPQRHYQPSLRPINCSTIFPKENKAQIFAIRLNDWCLISTFVSVFYFLFDSWNGENQVGLFFASEKVLDVLAVLLSFAWLDSGFDHQNAVKISFCMKGISVVFV